MSPRVGCVEDWVLPWPMTGSGSLWRGFLVPDEQTKSKKRRQRRKSVYICWVSAFHPVFCYRSHSLTGLLESSHFSPTPVPNAPYLNTLNLPRALSSCSPFFLPVRPFPALSLACISSFGIMDTAAPPNYDSGSIAWILVMKRKLACFASTSDATNICHVY